MCESKPERDKHWLVLQGLRAFLARPARGLHTEVPKTDAPRLCRALLQLLGFTADDAQAILVMAYEAFPTLDQNGSVPLLNLLVALESGFQVLTPAT